LIPAFFAFPFTIMFASLPWKETSFFVVPLPLSSFVFFSPSFTILVWPCRPVNFRFFGFLYRPPLAFLPAFMLYEKKFDLNRLRLGDLLDYLCILSFLNHFSSKFFMILGVIPQKLMTNFEVFCVSSKMFCYSTKFLILFGIFIFQNL
jgi:hypothetical protein